jgi:hypothetical protein
MVRPKVARTELAEADRVPSKIDGMPVDIQAVGEIRAL